MLMLNCQRYRARAQPSKHLHVVRRTEYDIGDHCDCTFGSIIGEDSELNSEVNGRRLHHSRQLAGADNGDRRRPLRKR